MPSYCEVSAGLKLVLCWLNSNLQTSSKHFVWIQLQRRCSYKEYTTCSTSLLKAWGFPPQNSLAVCE